MIHALEIWCPACGEPFALAVDAITLTRGYTSRYVPCPACGAELKVNLEERVFAHAFLQPLRKAAQAQEEPTP